MSHRPSSHTPPPSSPHTAGRPRAPRRSWPGWCPRLYSHPRRWVSSPRACLGPPVWSGSQRGSVSWSLSLAGPSRRYGSYWWLCTLLLGEVLGVRAATVREGFKVGWFYIGIYVCPDGDYVGFATLLPLAGGTAGRGCSSVEPGFTSSNTLRTGPGNLSLTSTSPTSYCCLDGKVEKESIAPFTIYSLSSCCCGTTTPASAGPPASTLMPRLAPELQGRLPVYPHITGPISPLAEFSQ